MLGGRSGGNAVLHIVDADASARDGLRRLALAAGFETHAYPNVERFLAELVPVSDGCVLFDASLLEAGARMCAAMKSRGVDWPVIVLSTGDDWPVRQAARNIGACFLLNKPVDAQALFDAIAWVTEREP